MLDFLVIVFQIQIANLALRDFDAERQTAIAGDAEAPRPFAISSERVRLPESKKTQFLRLLTPFSLSSVYSVFSPLWVKFRMVLTAQL
jgi:hypothetical protein